MTTRNFNLFSEAVKKRFAEMANNKMFVVGEGQEAWDAYLVSFPPGTNEIFRTRTEHDCSCCRSFIKNVGNIVAIENGALSSIWDLNGIPEPYQTVANAMSDFIKKQYISNVFITKFNGFGADVTREMLEDGTVKSWNHFRISVPSKFVNVSPDEVRGKARTNHDTLKRGVTEITSDSVNTITSLISDNLLYRGDEFKPLVQIFTNIQEKYRAAPNENSRELVVWNNYDSPAAHFRNSVVGTLADDLSTGVDLERAVKSYESKVAPTNYKRPTALITPGMVKKAMETIKELGLETALERRHATFSDVSVNSVLFVDNSVKPLMKDALEDLLMKSVKPKEIDKSKAESISIEDFISKVIPNITEMNVILSNEHNANFMSLTAPVHPNVQPLFKWDNNFAWSYSGNLTDSIKQRVKNAGGRVEDVSMRVSLSWNNTDDLDLHVIDPNKNRICFHNKMGLLDVDMNAGSLVKDPVENVRWTERLKDGVYQVMVNQYNRRNATEYGFELEFEIEGQLTNYSYSEKMNNNSTVKVIDIHIKDGMLKNVVVHNGIKGNSISREIWGLTTNTPVKVNSVIVSPNFWDDNAVGNKHWFFIIEGCKNPDPVRGIYNEFLNSELDKHRKVFEVLGEKTKCPFSENQMSGLGFSSTKREKVLVHAIGPKLNKQYVINF